MQAQFSIDCCVRPGGTILACTGELDLVARDRLVAAIDEVLTAGPRWVIVDLSSTTFLDCASMRLLQQFRNLLPRDTGWSVVCPPGPVRRALSVGGFPALQEVSPSVEAATAGPRRAAPEIAETTPHGHRVRGVAALRRRTAMLLDTVDPRHRSGAR